MIIKSMLTSLELQTAKDIMDGLNNKDMKLKYNITLGAVKKRVSDVLKKTYSKNRVEFINKVLGKVN